MRAVVGLAVVGVRIVGRAVGAMMRHPTSIGGMHVLLRQVFWVQRMPSLQPMSFMQVSSASRILRKILFTRDELLLVASVTPVRGNA